MKKYNELELNERKELNELFANWLKNYTHEVIADVMAKAEEIINNETSMHLLRELYKREQAETKEFTRSIESYLRNYEGHKEYNPHNHVLEHSEAYRYVLYDTYIAQSSVFKTE